MEVYRKIPIEELQVGLPVKAVHFQQIIENLDAAVDSQHPQRRIGLGRGEYTIAWKEGAIAAFISLTGSGQSGGENYGEEEIGGRAGETVESIFFRDGATELKVIVGKGGSEDSPRCEPTSLLIDDKQRAIAYSGASRGSNLISASDGVNTRIYCRAKSMSGVGESSFISAPDPNTGIGRFGSGGSVIVENGIFKKCRGGDGVAFIEWIYGDKNNNFTPILESKLKAGAPLTSELMINLVSNSDSVCGSKAHIYEFKKAGSYTFEIPKTATYLRFTVTDTGGSGGGGGGLNGDFGETTMYIYRVSDLPESIQLTIPAPVETDSNSIAVSLGLDGVEPISTLPVINPNYSLFNSIPSYPSDNPSAKGYLNGMGGRRWHSKYGLSRSGKAGCITIEVIY